MNNDATSFTPFEMFLAEEAEAVDFVVEGLLPAGGLSLIGAKPKVGKSTLVRVLAHAVASGTPFLGRQTTRGSVLYVSIEERRDDVRRHFAQLGNTGHPDLLVHVGPVPGNPKGSGREALRRHRMAWLTAEIARFQPSFVGIDTWGRFVALRDSNDYSEVTEASEALIDLAHQSGAHFAFTHHARKQDAELIDALVGSTGIVGAVDTVLLLRRHRDGARTIASNQRVGLELGETVLQLDEATGMLSVAGTLDAHRQAEALARILTVLGTKAMREEEIRERVGMDNRVVSAALRDALRDHLITRSGKPLIYSRENLEA
jgi:predicted ATP-dependent serine protease